MASPGEATPAAILSKVVNNATIETIDILEKVIEIRPNENAFLIPRRLMSGNALNEHTSV